MTIYDLVAFANPACIMLAFAVAFTAFLVEAGPRSALGAALLMAGISIGLCAFLHTSDGAETVAQHAVHWVWRDMH